MAVGKSSLAGRFNQGRFNDVYQNTIGGAYFQKVMNVPDPQHEPGQPPRMQQVKLHIWDTGGQEQFRSMMSLYYRDADAALICFDISAAKSFDSVAYWIGEMEKNCNNERKNFVLALAGNKCDIEDSKKQIPMSVANETAKENEMCYHETSAKTGEGVNELFMELI